MTPISRASFTATPGYVYLLHCHAFIRIFASLPSLDTYICFTATPEYVYGLQYHAWIRIYASLPGLYTYMCRTAMPGYVYLLHCHARIRVFASLLRLDANVGELRIHLRWMPHLRKGTGHPVPFSEKGCDQITFWGESSRLKRRVEGGCVKSGCGGASAASGCRCQENSANVRQSRPDFDLDLQEEVHKT